MSTNLPQLPTPCLWDSAEREHGFDATQMLAYGATCAAAALEEAAKVCDGIALKRREDRSDYPAEEAANAIRQLKENT